MAEQVAPPPHNGAGPHVFEQGDLFCKVCDCPRNHWIHNEQEPPAAPVEKVTIEWTVEGYTRYRASVDKADWEEALQNECGDEYLGLLEADEVAKEYDYGVVSRRAYVGDEQVL